jgi:rod shape determining protein RodA
MPQTFNQQKGIFQNIDWVMILLWFLLVAVGWFNIYSSGNKEELINIFDLTQRYGKQLLWIGAALGIAFTFLLIDPRTIPPLSFLVYIGVMLLLVAVVLFGKEVNNSRSWFPIGGFNLQPAEFAKLAAALALSRYLSSLNFDMRSRKSMRAVMGIILLPMGLIMLQPDMGSAIVLLALVLPLYRFGLWPWYLFGAIAIVLLFLLDMLFSKIMLTGGILLIAGALIYLFRARRREMVLIGLIAGAAILLVFVFDFAYHYGLKPHQKERIEVYLSNLEGVDKDIRNVGYNFYQSKVAIGSGGFFGKGYLKGTQTKMNFIPEQDTDFIFCTVGEEWGFLGSLFVITLYLLLLLRLVQRAEIQRSRFSQVYAYCVASILFFHFMVNVGMTIGLAPVIGIPLPFMSYGGSSLWAFTILLFIFIKQDMHRYEVIG